MYVCVYIKFIVKALIFFYKKQNRQNIQEEYILEKFLSLSFAIGFRQFNRKYRKAEKSNNTFLYVDVDVAFAAFVIRISISVLSQ